MFNSVSYFETLNGKLKSTKGIYTFCRISGLNNLEEVISNLKSSTAFMAVDDTDDGMTIKKGPSYFKRRVIVVFLLKKHNSKDQSDRQTKLEETRTIYNSLISKLIIDKNTISELAFFDDTRIPYHEVPGIFLGETTGLYFSITIEEPVNLAYNANDWE